METLADKIGKEAFIRLKPLIGEPLTVFCLCAVLNLPYLQHAAVESWDDYVDGFDGNEFFTDGVTDINSVILDGMESKERWEIVWGDGYSENDYKRLDEQYRIMTAQLDVAGGVIDPQQRETARYCARLALEREKLILKPDKENIAMAKSLDEMIRKNLSDCDMRKTDQLPSQKQRLDGFVDALRKKTGLGGEMTQEDVLSVFYAWCQKKKYPMTTDAADHLLLSILRTMAKNDDLPVPAGLQPEDGFSIFEREFEKKPNLAEKEAYKYLSIEPGTAILRNERLV